MEEEPLITLLIHCGLKIQQQASELPHGTRTLPLLLPHHETAKWEEELLHMRFLCSFVAIGWVILMRTYEVWYIRNIKEQCNEGLPDAWVLTCIKIRVCPLEIRLSIAHFNAF